VSISDNLRQSRARIRFQGRGAICESRIYRGPHAGRSCFRRATGYQRQHDLHLCHLHARGYLNVEARP